MGNGAGGAAEGAARSDFLRIEKLTKRFDEVAAVDDVSIDIAQGEIFALLGSSGCGKSTLLRMLAGFETPTSGRIRLEGEDIAGIPPYERPINMMFQSYALFPHLTVQDNVAFGLRREGMPPAQIAERVEKMLRIVQLTPYAKRKPHQLSGGQQQRVALARCLAKRPKLLLLDEPLGALDRKLREQTQFELHNIIKQVGVTCVLVTHDQEEAMTMADRIAVMSQGRFLQVGRPVEIYETPNCRFVADFIGTVNLLDGVLEADAADHGIVATPYGRLWVGHGVSATLGSQVSVALRPEKVRLLHEAPADAQYNCMRGRITETGYFGSYSLYRMAVDGGLELKIEALHRDRHGEPFQRGDEAFATFAPDALVVLTS